MIARKGSSCHADWKEIKSLAAFEANAALSSPYLLFSLSRNEICHSSAFGIKVLSLPQPLSPIRGGVSAGGAARGMGSGARWPLLAPHESPVSRCHLGSSCLSICHSPSAASPVPSTAPGPAAPNLRAPHIVIWGGGGGQGCSEAPCALFLPPVLKAAPLYSSVHRIF